LLAICRCNDQRGFTLLTGVEVKLGHPRPPFGPCPRCMAAAKKTLRNAEICALFVTELLQVSFCLLAVVREMVSA
jgi:hypothetical protein